MLRFVLAGLLAAAPATSQAAELRFIVDSTRDATDAHPGDGACADGAGACTLRAALAEADGKDVPVFLDVRPGTYVIEAALTSKARVIVAGASAAQVKIVAAPSFRGDRLLTFEAGGADGWRELSGLTLDGAGVVPVVAARPGAALRIRHAVVRGGTSSDEGGAGIVAYAPFVLERASVIDNKVERGGGRGGALLVEQASAWITQSTFTGNTGRNSGGIFARNSPFVIEHSSFVGNGGMPVGGYQQNPQSSLRVKNTWFGESEGVGSRSLDCRSTADPATGIRSEGNNLTAITGPTGDKLVDGAWKESWEFACVFGGKNDRSGTNAAPLQGAWRRVTDATGVVGVEALAGHPAYRSVAAADCPPEDAFGRPVPAGEPCDVGALRSGGEAAPVAAAPVAPPAAPRPATEPAGPEGAAATLWVALAAVAVMGAAAGWVLTRRAPRK